MTQVQTRRAQTLFNVAVAAQRALHEAALLLALKIILGGEPAFKDMAGLALEIKHLHGESKPTGGLWLATSAQQIPIHEPGKSESKKHGPGDRVELPSLGSHLPRSTLKHLRENTHQYIQRDQLKQPDSQRLACSCHRSSHRPTLIHKRQIGSNKGGHNDQPNGTGERHRKFESVNEQG